MSGREQKDPLYLGDFALLSRFYLMPLFRFNNADISRSIILKSDVLACDKSAHNKANRHVEFDISHLLC